MTVDPPVLPAQRAALIVGNREVPAGARVGTTATLAFDLGGFSPGTYLARVRIDGVDSLPFLDPDAAVPAFDPSQTIVVNP